MVLRCPTTETLLKFPLTFKSKLHEITVKSQTSTQGTLEAEAVRSQMENQDDSLAGPLTEHKEQNLADPLKGYDLLGPTDYPGV